MSVSITLSQLALAALNSYPDPSFVIDERKHVLHCSKSASKYLNKDVQYIVGNVVNEVFACFGGASYEKFTSLIETFFRNYHTDSITKEYILESDGCWRGVIEIRIEPVVQDEGEDRDRLLGALIILRDVTSQWSLKNELHYQATHDSLTGLLNRFEFEKKLAELIQHGRDTGIKHSFCFIDLNKFKEINDRYGHGAGDKLLKELSRHIMAQLRKGDMLGRLGGDEFGLILGGCSGRDAIHVLEGIQNSLLGYKFAYNGQNFQITMSIGVINIDKKAKSVTEIIHMADLACYEAKKQEYSPNGIVYYPENDLQN